MRGNYQNVRKIRIPESTRDMPITFLSGKNARYTYVYVTDEKRYLSDKKYNQNKRVCIGRLDYKLDSDWRAAGKYPTEMLPNDDFAAYFSKELYTISSDEDRNDSTSQDEEELSRGDSISIGVHLVLEQLVQAYKLNELLSDYLDEIEVNRIFDLAAYMITKEDNVALHFENYEYRHLLFQEGNGIKDEQIGRLMASIPGETVDAFLKAWNAENSRRNGVEQVRVYFVGDGTDHHCQAGDIEIAEYGSARIDNGTPVISMMPAYDLLHKQPVCYELYDGNITDMSECKYLGAFLKALGYGNFGVILDRGCYSSDNIGEFVKSDIAFILMAKGWKRFIRKQVLMIRGSFENTMSSYVERYGVYGTTISCSITNDEHMQYCHVFFNPAMVSIDQADFREKLNLWRKKLDKTVAAGEPVDKHMLTQCSLYFNFTFGDNAQMLSYTENTEEINNELKLAGYYVVVTSEKMTDVEALTLYKSRDANEKMNMFDWTIPGNEAAGSDETLQGKGFTAFISLILRNGMYVNLKKEEANVGEIKQIYDVAAAIGELEKIEVTRYPHDKYALRRPLTRKQKDILHAFGLTESRTAKVIERAVRKLNGIKMPS